jgi:hypothetical protein
MPLSSLSIHIQENLIWREDPFNSSKKSKSFPPSSNEPVFPFPRNFSRFFLLRRSQSTYVLMYVYLQSLHIRTVHTNFDIYIHTHILILPIFLFLFSRLPYFFFFTCLLILLRLFAYFLYPYFSSVPTDPTSMLPFLYLFILRKLP